MKLRPLFLLGIILLLPCMNAVADNGSIQVVGMASVVIPADTATIAIKVQNNDNNTTQALIANYNLLNKTKDALKAAGLIGNDLSPRYFSSATTYCNSVCHNVNNTTTCSYETSHIVASQMTVQMKRDGDKINKTLEVAKSSGATAAISGYSISDTKALLDEVRKKAMDNAQQNAQDYATAYGFTLGKIIGISNVPGPIIEIGSPVRYYSPNRFHGPFGFGMPWSMGNFGGYTVQPGMAYVRSFVRVTYAIS